MTYRLSRIGVLSFAMFQGIVGALLGLLIGVLYGLVIILISTVGGAAASSDPEIGTGGAAGIAGMGIIGGLAVMIMAPLFYGIAMFIGGLIMGLFMNLALRMSGGVEIDLNQNKF